MGDEARFYGGIVMPAQKNTHTNLHTYQTFISLCPAKPLYPPYEGILYTRCDGLSIEKIKKNKEKPGKNNEKF